MKNVTALLLTVLLILPIAIMPQTFAPKALASRVYLEPSTNVYTTNNATVGTLFNVTVKVDDVPAWPSLDPTVFGAAAWQVFLEFNDTILNVTRWYEPRTDPTYLFYGKDTSALPAPPDPGYVHLGSGDGRVQVGGAMFPPPPAAPNNLNGTSGPGPFKLAIITFVITMVPDSLSGPLSSALHFGTVDTFFLDGDANTQVLPLEDGSYTISFAPPAPHIWLQNSPPTYATTVPEIPFNISVNIMNVSASDYLVGIQFEMLYNSSFLKFLNGYNGSFLEPYATHGTFFTIMDEPSLTPSKFSRVVFGQLLLPNDTGFYDQTVWPSGSGEIATLTFQPTVRSNFSEMLTPIPLFGESFIDKDGQYLPAGTPLGTDYTYTNPPEPTITVNPNPFYSSGVGETFPINVTIAGLDARWQLTYIAFRLSYDNTTINATGATEGSFMSTFGNTTFTATLGADYVDISVQVTPSGPFPSGAGTLATINFNATVGPPAMSGLTFSNKVLLDPNGLADSAIWADGTYAMHQRLVHSIVVGLATYDVITVSDAAVTPVPMLFDPDHRMLNFNVTGLGIPHFVDVTMPNVLISASPDKWLAIVDSSVVSVAGIPVNATHTTVTVNYNFTSQPVFLFGTTAIPEMSPGMMPLLLVLTSLLSVGVAGVAYSKRKRFTVLE